MKKSTVFIAIAFAIVATAVAVVSCKKEKQDQTSNNMEQSVQPTDNMNEYLISFKKKLLSAQNGEEFISLEQAQRDLGNLLNFDFGDANYATNVFQRDTINSTLTLTQGRVDLSQLAHIYALSHKQLEETFDQVSLPNKSVYTIRCTFNQMAPSDDSVDVELILTTRGFDETAALRIVPSLYDCWTVFGGHGNCDGLYVGYDHVSVLRSVYFDNHPGYSCLNGSLYFTDESETSFDASQYPETGTPIYNIGCRLWAGNSYPYEYDEVEADEMVYYYNNLCDIIDDKMAALNDDDYKVTNLSCSIFQVFPLLNNYYFNCKIEYGKPHCTGFIDQNGMP